MKPSYTRAGANYLPAIIHDDGRKETIFGDPVATRAEALKYARLHIIDRNVATFRRHHRANYAATRADGI